MPWVAGSGPWADLRTSGAILVCAVYVVASQLRNFQRLDSFGLPMGMFAVASCTSIVAAVDSLRKANSVEEPPPQTHLAIRVLAPALALSGSWGLFTHWVLARIQQTSTPAFHAMVPLTFAANSIFKLLVETKGLSPNQITQTKPLVVAGILLGAGLFQHAAWVRMRNPVLFGLGGLLTASLLPTFVAAFVHWIQNNIKTPDNPPLGL